MMIDLTTVGPLCSALKSSGPDVTPLVVMVANRRMIAATYEVRDGEIVLSLDPVVTVTPAEVVAELNEELVKPLVPRRRKKAEDAE